MALTAARDAVEAHGAASITLIDASETEGANSGGAAAAVSRLELVAAVLRAGVGVLSSRRGWCCCATRR